MKRVVCLILICVLLSGCGKADAEIHESLFCMDTVMDIQLWGDDASDAAGKVADLLRQLEDEWDAGSESSAVAILNSDGDGLTAEQKAFIHQVQALSERTGGAFDPKLYAVTEAWGFPTDGYRLPSQPEIDAALQQERWDLGAAMKGHAGDRCVALLEGMAVDRALLDLGGNIQTYGEKEDGSPWRIGIQSPEGGGTVGTVCVTGTMSVVTSGDYQRYFELDGIRYCHILDPETGYPADSGLSSVTVICRNGLTADVLSTALFVMGLEDSTRFWQESDDFEAVFILTSGEIYATEGVDLSGCTFEVIHREK